jgi:hypothetical protein
MTYQQMKNAIEELFLAGHMTIKEACDALDTFADIQL